ncbi:helix-turn-helix transcriptional regulator [Cyanobacterium aponinum FACHB-4101]|uniref:helix-turn-helix domain-containing protein n=1 Tax=Cyanobacterium aponinum TaxID=379064 RepID=UPI0016816699|nr:helix-turn-helix transcriptional regulator [Cyanobacterium aponinum]MBD2395672.1 helix-turn-helix transcriptional regulator [Cyanobacterium aponinum FACHB-4101]
MKNNRSESSVFYQIRKKTGLSQEDLGRLLDVSFTTINRWENGKQAPRLDFKQWKTITILLTGMGIDARDLPDNAFGEIKRLKDKKFQELKPE